MPDKSVTGNLNQKPNRSTSKVNKPFQGDWTRQNRHCQEEKQGATNYVRSIMSAVGVNLFGLPKN